MHKAFKFRIYPNRNQIRELSAMLETHRRIYNACLAQRKESYERLGIGISYGQQSAWFKTERSSNMWFAKTNFSSAQATMRRLDKAFKAFFRRLKSGGKPGYPRFKAEGQFDSVEFPSYGDGIRLKDGRLRVQHVGLIRVKQHREIEGEIKTATVKREGDKWYVVLSCDLGDKIPEPSENLPVGIDVGLEYFLSTSDGEHEENPRILKKSLAELRSANRSLSRKKRGSKRRRKSVSRLRKIHARVANRRRDHAHKIALKLVRRYGVIVTESLRVKNMLRNRRLSRAIADASWGGFLAILKHKAESAGVLVIEVNPRGTSQQCSGCGAVVTKDLSVRTHQCPDCGLVLQRDVNAARNILARALARTEPAGANGHSSAVA